MVTSRERFKRLTGNHRVVGDTDATDPVVSGSGDFSSTSGPVAIRFRIL